MCGITGIINFDSREADGEILAKMTRLLSHRGPDDEGLYCSGPVGLGHRRLSIIDLSPRGHQPMSNEDASIWITYNGEIYNHLALRDRLERKGHLYKSRTDTETVIHLYEEEGADCLKYLDGEFAFAIWDADKKILFAARDRLGIKPFYYFLGDKCLVFASEAKSILLHPAVKKEVDLQALSHYFSFSVAPAPLTLFKNIFKLEAGHCLTVSREGGFTKRQYWDALPQDKVSCPEVEAIENIRAKLRDSIRERLMSDVPFGVFLSGGIDSSTNVAFMSSLLKEPVKTFNVAIEGRCGYDESDFAGSVSRHFKTEFHTLRINFQDFKALFRNLAYHTDEPLCDYACIPNFYLAKLARQKGVPVIQVGEGNDEVFCGYKSYLTSLNLIRYYSRLPRFVKSGLFNSLKLISGKDPHYSIEQAMRGEEVYLGGSYLFTEREKRSLFNGSVNSSGLDSSCDYVSRLYKALHDKLPEVDALDKMVYLDLKVRLPELLLMRADKMTMANSVEARLPFLDYQFVEYALSLPLELKIKHGITKYVFKESLKGILPREVIRQQKKGFAGNPLNIFSRDFQDYIWETYARTEPLLSQWFNLDAVREKLNFGSRKMDFREGMKTWSIFSLMLWLEEFFHK